MRAGLVFNDLCSTEAQAGGLAPITCSVALHKLMSCQGVHMLPLLP